MKKKIRYTDDKGELAGLEAYEVLPKNFLPPPEAFAHGHRNVRISLNVTEQSLEAFRKMGKRTGVGYQQLMRGVLDFYARTEDGRKLKAA
jgi:predicted DNA binding CopG/RHH family protein